MVTIVTPITPDPLSKLTLRRNVPKKREIYFRLDSPVLIIAATWHDTEMPYGRHLFDALLMRYVGNEDAVSVHHGHDQQRALILIPPSSC